MEKKNVLPKALTGALNIPTNVDDQTINKRKLKKKKKNAAIIQVSFTEYICRSAFRFVRKSFDSVENQTLTRLVRIK